MAGAALMVKSTTFSVTGTDCVTDPFVPLMANVESAAVVTPDVSTVKVDVPVLPVIVVGLKLDVAPVGSPVTVRCTSPVNPFSAVLLTVYVVVPPTTTGCVAGVADKAKTGTAFTMRRALVKWVRPPLVVPVTVIVKVPAAAVGATFTVSFAVPVPVIEVWSKVAVTSAGSPLTDRAIAPVKSLMGEVEIVYESLEPVLIGSGLGSMHKEKSGVCSPLPAKENMNVP